MIGINKEVTQINKGGCTVQLYSNICMIFEKNNKVNVLYANLLRKAGPNIIQVGQSVKIDRGM